MIIANIICYNSPLFTIPGNNRSPPNSIKRAGKKTYFDPFIRPVVFEENEEKL